MKSFVPIPNQKIINKDGEFMQIFLTSKTIVKDFVGTTTSHDDL